MRDLKLGLTAEQKKGRLNSIGGSDANIILSGDPARVLALWEEKTGKREPEDLSGVLPVQMGSFTEPLNIYWFERTMGIDVTREGEAARHPDYGYMHHTLDGVAGDALLECKHVNAFSKIEDVTDRYMPQLHHGMIVTGLERAYLSVFLGTQKYEAVEVTLDPIYAMELLDAERAFWDAVQSDTPPDGAVVVAAPKVTDLIDVDMTGNNEWASLAGDWLDNQAAAKVFDKAVKGIKDATPDNAAKAFGHGITVKRAKNGALRISKEAA